MLKEKENQECFDAYYHANEFNELFFYSFDSLEEAVDILRKEYPHMKEVEQDNIQHPFIRVIHKSQIEKENIKFYYFNVLH